MLLNIEEYEIGVSFSGEDREYVEKVVSTLRSYNLRVFYDKNYTFSNLRDELPDIYANKIKYFSIIFISKNYKADYSSDKNNYTDLERKVIQSTGLKKSNFIIYARFDDTNIDGYIDTDYTYDLRTLTLNDFIGEIINKINQKKLDEAQIKNITEGYDSSLKWIIGWNGVVNPPQKPPRHRLLNKVFVENEVYKKKLEELLNGRKRSGITGFVGMGGVGKTYTAQKICWELIEKHNWQVVYIVLLEKGAEEALDDLLDKFGLAFVANLSIQEKVSVVQKFFEEVNHTFPNLLVVLDNAENFPNLPLLLDALGVDTPTLITSRKKECEIFIDYDEIKPLEKEKAIEYCQQILFQEEISDKKNDIECLAFLANDLGGHPLALRLALSNFSQNSMAMNKKNRFCNLRQELKNKGIINLSSNIPLSNTLDETRLHKNITSTFEWTYKELSHKDKNIESRGAYMLLPILSILGTNRVTLVLCQEAIKNLIDNSDNDSEWKTILEKLVESEELFETSISILAKLSLLEIIDEEDEDTVAVHPLIREFALSHLEQYSERESISNEKENDKEIYQDNILKLLDSNEKTYDSSTQKAKTITNDENYVLLPNDTKVYHMAVVLLLDVIKDKKDIFTFDAIIDLLYRTSKKKHITTIVIGIIKKLFDTLYYLPLSWSDLKEILEILYNTTTNLNLQKEKYWVCFQLGELKDRMGYKEGISLVKEGVSLFLENMQQGRNSKIDDSSLICDFSIHKNNWDAVWASLYAQTYKKDQQINEEGFIHLTQNIRLLYNERNTYNISQIFNEHKKLINNNLSEIYQMDLSSKNQTLISNTILDLIEVLKLKVRRYETLESIQSIDNLYSLALKNQHNEISIGHQLEYLIAKNIELFSFNLINDSLFSKNIETIKNELRINGIRIFLLESLYQNTLAKKEIERENFTQAIIHLEKEKQALSHVHHNESQGDKLKNKGLKLICLVQQNKSIELEFENFKNELREYKDNEALALQYLIQAVLINDRDYALKSEKAFLEYWGYVPPFSRNLLMKQKGWGSIKNNITIENLVEWQVDYNKLPNRVTSQDGRTMRLIKSGIQWDKDGKEIWLYPFYIDEEPLQKEDLEKVLDEEESLITNDFNATTISVNSTNIAKIAKKADKKIPTQTELYASYLQMEQNIKPERWSNQDETVTGMIKRIQNLITTNKVLENENNYSLNNYDNYKIHNDLPFKNIEEFYTLEWLKSSEILYQNYQHYILSLFDESPIDNEQKIILAETLVTSLSLNISEKKRVLDAAKANGLYTFQCEEIIRVFSEEKTKFHDLVKEHPGDIKKLLNKSFNEFLTIMHIYDIQKIDNINPWYCFTSIGHTDEWLKHEDCNISATAINLEDKPDDLLPVIRFVKPIFTISDLDGLEEIR